MEDESRRPSRREEDDEEEIEERPKPRSRRRYYDDEDDEPRPRMNNDAKNRLIQLGMAVVLSFLVVFVWANASLVSRSAYETDITNIVTDLGKVQKAVEDASKMSATVNTINSQYGSISDKVTANAKEAETIKASLKDYAKTDSVSQFGNNLASLQNQVNNIQSQVNNFKTADTSGLQSSIDSLKAQITSLDTRIKALEVTGTSGGSSKGAITVAVKTLGNNAFAPIDNKYYDDGDDVWVNGSGGGYDGLQASMRLAITNNSLYDVDDAVIDLQFAVYPALPSYYIPSLSGGGVPWHKEWSDTQYMEFYNGAWGLSVPAGQTITINLTLLIQGGESSYNNNSLWDKPGGYYYQLEATVT